MSTIDLNHVVSMNNVSVMNSNFDIIEAAINGDVIHRTGGQNTMEQSLDLNGHDLLNGNIVSAQTIKLAGEYLTVDNAATISPAILAVLLQNPPPIGLITQNSGSFTTIVGTDVTNSTSSTTGAMKLSGGLGVAKDIWAGGYYHGGLVATTGSVDGTIIGAVNPASGKFTTLTTTGAASLGATSATSLNATPVGNLTPSTGAFSTLTASGAVSGAGFVSLMASPGPVGSTTPSSGSFTTLAASGAVSGAGFIALHASPGPIGSTTPSTGAFTSISATLPISPHPAQGILGTTTASNANAGSWGEYGTNTASATSLTTGTAANGTFLTLSAGDWDVSGGAVFIPAGTTTVAAVAASISTTSTVHGGLGQITSLAATFTTGAQQQIATPTVRLSLSSSTSVFLVMSSTFGVSTMTANSFIRARRVR